MEKCKWASASFGALSLILLLCAHLLLTMKIPHSNPKIEAFTPFCLKYPDKKLGVWKERPTIADLSSTFLTKMVEKADD